MGAGSASFSQRWGKSCFLELVTSSQSAGCCVECAALPVSARFFLFFYRAELQHISYIGGLLSINLAELCIDSLLVWRSWVQNSPVAIVYDPCALFCMQDPCQDAAGIDAFFNKAALQHVSYIGGLLSNNLMEL